MHMHPTIGAKLLSIGREFGLPRVRIPCEPPTIMARCGVPPTFGARAMAAWSGVLRAQARRAGIPANDAIFGLTWTGAFTEERLLRLIPHLPEGDTELYFHPAAGRDVLLDRWMPAYRHEAELTALTSPVVRTALSNVS